MVRDNESQRELARPRLGLPSEATVHRYLRTWQGTVSNSLQSYREVAQVRHREIVRMSHLLPGHASAPTCGKELVSYFRK